MSKRKLTLFDESLFMNNITYLEYLDRLKELAITSIEWEGFPDTIDVRFLELQLFDSGKVIYFNDEVVGDLCLCMSNQSSLDVYGNPVLRRAYSPYNNYTKLLKPSNSVIIWDNYLHTRSYDTISRFARMLWLLDMIMLVNVNAQKTPVIIQSTEKQKSTLLNLYKEYAGNMPFIFADKNTSLNDIKALSTQAPFLADKIYDTKVKIWNEALTYLGISNVSYQKKERLISDEVLRSQGGTLACQNIRLKPREIAARQINKLFGLNVSVKYSENLTYSIEEQFMEKEK